MNIKTVCKLVAWEFDKFKEIDKTIVDVYYNDLNDKLTIDTHKINTKVPRILFHNYIKSYTFEELFKVKPESYFEEFVRIKHKKNWSNIYANRDYEGKEPNEKIIIGSQKAYIHINQYTYKWVSIVTAHKLGFIQCQDYCKHWHLKDEKCACHSIMIKNLEDYGNVMLRGLFAYKDTIQYTLDQIVKYEFSVNHEVAGFLAKVNPETNEYELPALKYCPVYIQFKGKPKVAFKYDVVSKLNSAGELIPQRFDNGSTEEHSECFIEPGNIAGIIINYDATTNHRFNDDIANSIRQFFLDVIKDNNIPYAMFKNGKVYGTVYDYNGNIIINNKANEEVYYTSFVEILNDPHFDPSLPF